MRSWNHLRLVDQDGEEFDYYSERRWEFIDKLTEFRETSGMKDVFFARMGLPHETDDASTWGPATPDDIDWTGFDDEFVSEEFACPKCGERRVDYLVNEEGHVTCATCEHEYDVNTFFVKNPWTGELAEISEMEVTQEKLDFLATLMDDDIREAIHHEFAPCSPGKFFSLYVERVGAEEAGKIWFT